MRILLAIDGSAVSDVATREVKERPWPADSLVRVLHVVPPLYPQPGAAWTFYGATPPVDLGDTERRLVESAREMLHGTAKSLVSSGLQVESEAIVGDAREGILRQAREWEADLIVVGSHGRTGFKRWMLGSVAEAVVRHAPCSVEVVRARDG